jgi:hypothetical protein
MIDKNGNVYSIKYKRLLSKYISIDGYECIGLQGKTNFIHRLLATQFIENKLNLPMVNHKDGNKLNNNVDNLEWCSYSYNSKHAIENCLLNSRKKVIQISKEDEVIKHFDSIIEASSFTSIDGTNISRVCNGQRKTAGGYSWKFRN